MPAGRGGPLLARSVVALAPRTQAQAFDGVIERRISRGLLRTQRSGLIPGCTICAVLRCRDHCRRATIDTRSDITIQAVDTNREGCALVPKNRFAVPLIGGRLYFLIRTHPPLFLVWAPDNRPVRRPASTRSRKRQALLLQLGRSLPQRKDAIPALRRPKCPARGNLSCPHTAGLSIHTVFGCGFQDMVPPYQSIIKSKIRSECRQRSRSVTFDSAHLSAVPFPPQIGALDFPVSSADYVAATGARLSPRAPERRIVW